MGLRDFLQVALCITNPLVKRDMHAGLYELPLVQTSFGTPPLGEGRQGQHTNIEYHPKREFHNERDPHPPVARPDSPWGL